MDDYVLVFTRPDCEDIVMLPDISKSIDKKLFTIIADYFDCLDWVMILLKFI